MARINRVNGDLIERLARETHHAFRGIEFPEAARCQCLKFSCLGASRGPGTGSPAVDDDPEIRNARLAARCNTFSIPRETYLFLIAVAAAHLDLSIRFLCRFLRTVQRHGCASCPRVCRFLLPRLRVPTIPP